LLNNSSCVITEDSINGSKPFEMNATINIKDIDTISEAETIKDSNSSDNRDDMLSVNDNTEVDTSPTEVMNVLQILESAV